MYFASTLAAVILLAALVLMWWRPQIGLAINVVGLPIVSSGLFALRTSEEGGVTLVLVATALVSILLLRIRWSTPLTPPTLQELGVFLFCAMMATSLLYTVAPEYGTSKVLLLLASAIPVVVLARLCFSSERSAIASMNAIAWIGAGTVLVLFVGYLSGAGQGTARFGQGGSIKISMYASVVVIFWLFMIQHSGFWGWILAAVVIPQAFLIMAITGSRGPLWGLLIAGALVSLQYHTLLRNLTLFVVISLGLALTVVLAAPEELQERLAAVQWLGSARQQYAEEAVSLYAQKPGLGWGAGGFAVATGQGDSRTYPHNLWLEAASETGTIGFLALVLASVPCFPVLLRLRRCSAQLPAFSLPMRMFFWAALLHTMVTADAPLLREWYAVLGMLGGASRWMLWQHPPIHEGSLPTDGAVTPAVAG